MCKNIEADYTDFKNHKLNIHVKRNLTTVFVIMGNKYTFCVLLSKYKELDKMMR